MLKALANTFKIPELKQKIIITLGLLVVYRLGCFIPTPGINSQVLASLFKSIAESQGGALFGMMNIFSGGALAQMTIFALGIMPYISASIILQLLTAVIPALEKLAKEGRAGYQKINQYTRLGTVVLAIVQSYFIAVWLENMGKASQFGELSGLVLNPGLGFRLLTMVTLTSGTIFIMWLGEQIQERGIGNGISLIIAVGIISRIPEAVYQLWVLISPFSSAKRILSPFTILIMAVILVSVILAVTAITQAQRKIPVQYARRMMGRHMTMGGQSYIPLKVDQSGVIAIIFAQSIILFPATLATFIPNPAFQKLVEDLNRGGLWYNMILAVLIVFFCYFYTAIVFNPIDVSENMKKYGGFVPGIRPGAATSDFLDFVMTRITLAGSIFIAFIAIFPNIIMAWLKVPYLVASFFGGTTILIAVGVMLDTIRQIESNLIMHNYDGFMKAGRIKGRR